MSHRGDRARSTHRAPVRRKNATVSKDITTAGPSRRQIAKGAAWAVPAVSVAAAAPALAASPVTACAPGTLQIVANCPPVLSTQSLNFTLTNPAGSGCEIPIGTPVDITVSGLIGLTVEELVSVNAGVLFQSGTSLQLAQALQSDDSVTIEVFPPSLLDVQAVGTATVAAAGSTASASYILANVLGVRVAICG